MYPQIREKDWAIEMLILSAFSWIAYLLAYEFRSRGFLFFATLPVWGLVFAIVLNQSFLHWFIFTKILKKLYRQCLWKFCFTSLLTQ